MQKSIFCKYLILFITCISEIYLDSSISTENSLIIDDYRLLCAGHPIDTKRGRLCMYHKESMSVQVFKVS